DEEREVRQPDVRLFVLFLDDYHVRRGNDLVVRKPLTDFIENQLGPKDMIAVMYPLTPVTALTFTRNHDSVVKAIEKFEGRKYNYEPRNEFEERYAYYPTATVEEIRTEVTLSALKGAAIKMGGMREGRKSIILVSEGFSSTLPPQLSDPSAAMPGFGNPYRGRAGVDVPNDPRVDSQRFFNSVNLIDMLREVFDAANRNNTSLYAVDPRGLAPFEYDVSQGVSLQSDRQSLGESLDTLRVLADNTDGRAIINRNDLATGMKQIIKDSSGYYLLGYTSTAAPTDGKFHKIDVKLVGRRSGLDVRSRKGYWAYTVEEAAAATAPSSPGATTTFDAPPGPLQLRMIVEGAHGQVVDSTTQDVTVPDFTTVQLSMSTPRVYRTRTARDMQLVKSTPDARPTPGRDFSRTERLLIRVDGYAPGAATPVMSAKPLNRNA